MQQNSVSSASSPSKLERRLDLVVPVADLNRDVDERLKRMARTVKMPGFRPGKVPLGIVKQQYGEEVRSEAMAEALGRVFGAAVQEKKLRVAGQPRIEPKPTDGGAQVEFSAVFEVYPEFIIGDVSGETIEKPTLEVTAADVEKTIEVLRKQRVRYETVARAGVSGDRVLVDFLGKKDGVPFNGGQASDYAVVLGEGSMLPEFESGLLGLAAGQSRTFDLTFPADYSAKDLAGQKVQFEVTMKQVQGSELPEIDAEFARSLGIADGDVVKMRSEIEGNVRREVKKRLAARIKEQVMEALAKTNEIELPKSLVDSEIERMSEAAAKDMAARGLDAKNFGLRPEFFVDGAKRRVSLGLILAELVKSQNLRATPETVRAKVDDSAQSYEHPDEVVRWFYADQQRLADIEAVVLEDNVVDWVLARAKVTEKAIAFDELMAGIGK